MSSAASDHDGPMRKRGEVRHRCPVCGVFMWEWDTGAVPPVLAERCESCRGVLLSEEQLDQLDDSMWGVRGHLPNEPAVTERRLACPVCRGPMKPLRWPGPPVVELDRCGGCRVFWLDDTELDGVRAVVQARTEAELNGMLESMDVMASPGSSSTPLEVAMRVRKVEVARAWSPAFSIGKLLARWRGQ